MARRTSEKLRGQSSWLKIRLAPTLLVLSLVLAALPVAANPLLHNSDNLSNPVNPKWGGSWGVTGGKYGVFTCATCHVESPANIKQVVDSIPNTIGAPVVKPVHFWNLTGFGNDEDGHATSQHICEVCHTQTNVHRYNTTGLTDINHQAANNTDCVGCHMHGSAFAASCTACHGSDMTSGSPISTGKHGAHMNTNVNASMGKPLGCVECHAKTVNSILTISNAANHRNGFADFSGARAGGSANYNGAIKQCSSFYCHSNGKQGTTAVSNVDPPPWNSGGNLGCNGCHGTTNAKGAPDYVTGGAGAPTANSHNRHALTNTVTTNIGCNVCHAMTTGNGTSIRSDLQSSNHINGNATDVFFNATGGFGPYNTVVKSCTVYCHSNGAPFDRGASNSALSWGGASLTCTSCHDGAPNPSNGTTTGLSGRHGKHTGANYQFTCDKCHPSAAADGTIVNKALHLNKVKDVTFNWGGSYDTDRGCKNTYCHSDVLGRAPNVAVKWSDTAPLLCDSCHRGTTTNFLTMTSNGHARLVGPQWIRKYPCTYCHNATVAAVVNANGNVTDGGINPANHVNKNAVPLNTNANVVMAPKWSIVGRSAPSYDPIAKTCSFIYCHSDGTTNPDTVKPFIWTKHGTKCNTCHGHALGSCSTSGCHDGLPDSTGNLRVLPSVYLNVTSSNPNINKYRWPGGQEWKAAVPMFLNQGPGSDRANSHPRHVETNFACDQCHASTVLSNASCSTSNCHTGSGSMSEVAHLDGIFHVNKVKDVVFKSGGTYNPIAKSCSGLNNSTCHVSGGTDPQWGGSVNSTVICLSCHGTTGRDVDSFTFKNFSTPARINMTEWVTTGHGRYSTSGRYPSGNPAANFPGNPCWYCHDNTVIHNDPANPFRLKQHRQFANRFQKECVYCHMVGTDSECLGCHNTGESLAPQIITIFSSISARWQDGTSVIRPDHSGMTDGKTSCITASCHFVDPAKPANDMKRHNTGAGLWTAEQLTDVNNQYMMMGVCLKCHDDDSGGKCTSCHTAPANNPYKYTIGFKAYSGLPLIRPKKARASSAHFGHKHYYQDFMNSGGWTKDPATGKPKGVWKGGKFCWDCHDPHGDSNIYMIHDQVATSTDGTFGIPKTRATVSFTRKQSGLDYARTAAPYNGICNVCHATLSSKINKHYGSDYGDGHNASKICTTCHEHRFTDSHADDQSCNSCHLNKPVPRHSAFGQSRDCVKCHAGTINNRMDIMGQFNGTSHHVQGTAVTNKQCYACHWESTPAGLIDVRYHLGYNYKTYTSVRNAKVDLVVWKPGLRPIYHNSTTAVQFQASNVGTTNERGEVVKLTNVCISCHSDQNNNTQPFGDCKTPNQYAWDRQSVAARYNQTASTVWGKYGTNGKYAVNKAFSAHGNATNNAGGFDPSTGVDGNIPNLRNASQSVQCFDCHSSHGSKVVGVTSSYATFNGSRNGGNLKETQAGKGGYSMTYKAAANTASGAINPYNAGAGQCFDCHLTQTTGITPWGYQSTFGATAPIKGYFDTDRFGAGTPAYIQRYPYKAGAITGGHFKASSFLNHSTAAYRKINGLCTACHDPHGVSPTLGANQAYAVPMLKGTWMTSPYMEDAADNTSGSKGFYKSYGPNTPVRPFVYTDDRTFNGTMSEDDGKFAGLCLQCHVKGKLLDGNTAWKSSNKIHQEVKGWSSGTQHSYSCSKCHVPHNATLPRLLITNCLDYNHRGQVASGGQPGSYNSGRGGSDAGSFPNRTYGQNCHGNGSNGWTQTWPDNSWNTKAPR